VLRSNKMDKSINLCSDCSDFISLINVAYADDDRPNLLSSYLLDESVRERQSNGASDEDSVY